MTDFCWHFLLEPVISVIKNFNDSPEKSRKQLFGIQRHPQFASSPPFLVSFPIPSLYYPPWSRMCVSCSVVSNSLQTHGWTVVCQAPLSMEFSGQEYWSGLPFPSPGDLLDPGIKQEYWSGLPFPSLGALPNPGIKPALQADSLPFEPAGKPP